MNLVFLGPAGSGKGTQASMLEREFGVCKLSTGDMLRKAVLDGTPLGKKAKSLMDAGVLVPDEVMINMISERVKQADCAGGFILDGFPRTLAQAEALDILLEGLDKSLNIVLELKVDDVALIDRISGRFTCRQCSAGYNEKYKPTKNPGVCDECGSCELIHREDDKAEAIAARLNAYHEQTAKLLTYYQNKGILHTVDGMADIDEVSKQIRMIVKNSTSILT